MSVEPQGAPTLPNVRDKPMSAAVEHYETGTMGGSAYQRPSKSKPGRTPDPGTLFHCLQNAHQPRRLAAVPTDDQKRQGPLPKHDSRWAKFRIPTSTTIRIFNLR
jgi:hypothetical protein